ncbi:MAG: rhodanese-like domain-containing protein [Betaproteobacteria bacterium]|nr:rhodanese-like domain-containing protein [Betaproteobacteria bacterium]
MKFLIENIFLVLMAVLSGGLLLWPSIRDRAGGERLDATQATRLMNDEDPILIDIRTPAEFEGGHVLRSRSFPLADLEKRIAEIKGKRPLLVIDADGARSARACTVLRKAGFERVYSLAGGVAAWRSANLPLLKS